MVRNILFQCWDRWKCLWGLGRMPSRYCGTAGTPGALTLLGRLHWPLASLSRPVAPSTTPLSSKKFRFVGPKHLHRNINGHIGPLEEKSSKRECKACLYLWIFLAEVFFGGAVTIHMALNLLDKGYDKNILKNHDWPCDVVIIVPCASVIDLMKPPLGEESESVISLESAG